MISDEERREVARKLREPSELLNIRVPLFEALDIRPDVAETLVSSKVIEHNNSRLLNRLADIIDRPTCRLDRTGTEPSNGRLPDKGVRVFELWVHLRWDIRRTRVLPALRRGGGQMMIYKCDRHGWQGLTRQAAARRQG